MSDEGHEEIVRKFKEISGISDEERINFYLAASNWNLESGLASFFETNLEDEEEAGAAAAVAAVSAAGGEEQQRFPHLISSLSSRPLDFHQPILQPPPSQSQPPPKIKKEDKKFATLASLKHDEESDEDHDDHEDDDRQAFYAGGSSTSGQQVLGPQREKKPDEIVSDVFKKAREAGAEETPAHPPPNKKKGGTFGGAGFKLGETAGPSEIVGDPRMVERSEEEASVEVVLRLWSTGFTVDSSPLRLYTDPANLQFLNSVKRGEIPAELVASAGPNEVSLSLEDHRREEYAPPKAQRQVFGGAGQKLGSPAPPVIGSAAPEDRSINEAQARSGITLTPSAPTTNVQLRLADGSRLVATFNHTHTISDLHTFINAARPEFAGVNYVLTLFPNKELTEADVTLKDANILNSALIQKMK